MSFHLPEFPLADPVAYFAVVMAVFLLVPAAFERFGIPGLIGLILVGAGLGPNGAEILARGPITQALGTAGLLFLMFEVGLELDLLQFRRHRRESLVFGIASFALPMALGVVLWMAFGHGLWSSLLLGAVFASHTLIAYPIASRFGIVKTRAVTTALGGVLITDILALLVLALVEGAGSGEAGWEFWATITSSLFGFALFSLWLLPKICGWFFRRLAGDGSVDFAFTMAVLFFTAFFAEFLRIEPIIGALLCGLALNRFIPEHSVLMSRIHFASNTIFVPFFLLSVGMLVDVRAFATPSNWGVIAAVTGGVVLSKAAAASLTARVFGFRADEGWVLFGLSVPHAASTMAIVLIGFRLGFFDLDAVNSLVVLVLVTCLIGPAAMTTFGRRVALRAEESPIHAGAAPSRTLIAISNPASRDNLIELGILLRERGSSEPLLPLMVVQEEAGRTEASVATAERMLGHAVMKASAASVPVSPLTRIANNVASGIGRAVVETRANSVIVGWEKRERTMVPQAVFGTVLDQLLDTCRAQVIEARPSRSLAADKIVLILPPFSNRHPGFGAAIQTVKRLAGQLAVPIQAVVIADKVEAFERAIGKLGTAAPVQFSRVTWREVVDDVAKQVAPNDLVVLISARPGTLPWHPRLSRLPRALAESMAQTSLLVLYPGESEPEADERHTPAATVELSDYLPEERIVRKLPGTDHREALETLLDTEFARQPVQRAVILEALERALQQDTTELRPGVALPHVRVAGIERPLVFLGLSREGVVFPHASSPARVVFLLISPSEPPEDHLRALSAVAGLCADDQWLEELMTEAGMEPLPPILR